MVVALHKHNTLVENKKRAMAVWVGLLFWLRVQSEGLELHKAEVADLIKLQEDRDSVFLDRDARHLIPRTRKCRQEGFHLPCQTAVLCQV